MMTVAELIELLKAVPQDAKIELLDTADCTETIDTWFWTRPSDGQHFLFLTPREHD
jgi:hypothetical protein